MKRTHRWAAMIAALMLAAGLVLPTIASAGEDSILYPGEKPKKLVAPWSFGEPDEPNTRAQRTARPLAFNLGSVRIEVAPGRLVVIPQSRSMVSSERRSAR